MDDRHQLYNPSTYIAESNNLATTLRELWNKWRHVLAWIRVGTSLYPNQPLYYAVETRIHGTISKVQ